MTANPYSQMSAEDQRAAQLNASADISLAVQMLHPHRDILAALTTDTGTPPLFGWPDDTLISGFRAARVREILHPVFVAALALTDAHADALERVKNDV